MWKLLVVGLAGLIGTLARYWLSGKLAARYGETFPVGTLAVNLVGCFVAGAAYHLLQERFLVDPLWRTAVFIGLLGGFTTFSSFGLQTLTLLKDGEIFLAGLNVLLSNVLGILLVWLGYAASKLLTAGSS